MTQTQGKAVLDFLDAVQSRCRHSQSSRFFILFCLGVNDDPFYPQFFEAFLDFAGRQIEL
jgi:hypothetical protein